MEKKEIRTAVGTICVDHIELGEMLVDMYFGIKLVPAAIQEKINREMESAKAERLHKMKKYCTDEELAWSPEGVSTEMLLHISIDNKGLSSWIEAEAADRGNDMLWACASASVDLSEHMAELQPYIVKAVTEKLNGMGKAG